MDTAKITEIGLLEWIRSFFFKTYTPFQWRHWDALNEAINESGVEAVIWPGGPRTVQRGCHVHDITIENLVQFKKLNRGERRYNQKKLNRKGRSEKSAALSQ